MNDVTILHLSDLHIQKMEGDRLPELFDKLLADINKFKENWQYVVVVVTGDIVYQKKYDARNMVFSFFKRLKNLLGDKCSWIHIVPGNHDCRNWIEDKTCCDIYKSWQNDVDKRKNKLAQEYFEEYENVFYEVTEEYIALINRIYDIFGREPVDKPYGVTIDHIGNEDFCFIECSTVINSGRGGEKDKRKIRFGKYQLDVILNEYNEKKAELFDANRQIALTFMLMHHPINWLKAADEEELQRYAISQNTLDVDFILCGHTHIQDIYHINKNYKSMMTLSTGIGWQDPKGTERLSKHMYAVYNASLEANSMEIYNRSTNEAGVFVDDVTLYSEEQISGMEGKIIFPLKTQKNKGYFEISTSEGRTSRAYYYTENIIADFHKYRTEMNQWFFDAGIYVYKLRESLYQEILSAEILKVSNAGSTKDEQEIVNVQLNALQKYMLYDNMNMQGTPELLKQPEYVIKAYKKLEVYLQYLCERLCRLLFYDFTEDERGRVHFRYGCQKGDEMHYKKLCAYGISGEDNVSEAIWGDLIEASFIADHTLIYSVNKNVCNKKLGNNWDNYLTAIPHFTGNILRFNKGMGIGRAKTEEVERPLLSFGITIKGKHDSLLYYFDYVDVAKAIGDLIEDFIRYTGIDFKKFVEYINGEKYE